jgi:hypothetical protein
MYYLIPDIEENSLSHFLVKDIIYFDPVMINRWSKTA